jgi:4-aminobutyrate aminotransferase
VIEECANNGLLVGAVGMFGNVIRVAPPLVITREEIDESVGIMDRVLQGLKS